MVIVAQLNKFTKIYWIVHLKEVNFVVRKFYLEKVVLKMSSSLYLSPTHQEMYFLSPSLNGAGLVIYFF